LIAIPDKALRDDYEAKIIDENLSVQSLKDLIREEKGLTPISKALSVARTEPLLLKL
jgi:hypothetical protein